MLKKKNFLKKSFALMLATVMTLSVDLPTGIGDIWSMFDFVKTTHAGTQRPETVISSVKPSGSGTKSNPYQINSPEKLQWFAEYVNNGNTSACAKLTSDIVINTGTLETYTSGNAIYMKSIGTSTYKYNGTFDGQGYSLEGLYYFSSTTVDIRSGLFAYTGTNAVISNVKINNIYIYNVKENLGGLCSENYGTIKNCSISGSAVVWAMGDNTALICGKNYGTIDGCNIEGTGGVSNTKGQNFGLNCGYNAGTIKNCTINRRFVKNQNDSTTNFAPVCGFNDGGTIDNCTNNGEVFHKNGLTGNIGGICGKSYGGTISNCTNNGEVRGYSYVGGICGELEKDAKIINCKNTGNINRRYNSDENTGFGFGGICGSIFDGNNTVIENCYNTGTIFAYLATGGICGNSDVVTSKVVKPIIRKCYNTGSVTGTAYTGGIVGFNTNTEVLNCYNTGSVTSSNESEYVGGIVGINEGYVESCYNSSSVSNGGGVVGYNDSPGYVKYSYFNTGSYSGKAVGKYYGDASVIETSFGANNETFKSGEVAYHLQGEQSEQVWGQKIGTDNLPALGGAKVYYGSGIYHNHSSSTCTLCRGTKPTVSNGVYLISNKDELLWFTDTVNSAARKKMNARVTADIDMGNMTVTHIGANEANAFTGVFDGDNHTIKNYVVTTDNMYDDGLFGFVDGGTIKNVKAYSTLNLNFNNSTNSNSGHAHSGFVAHLCNNAVVSDCEVHTDVKILSPGNYNRVAIVAANAQDGAKVENCSAYGSVTSSASEYMLTNAGGIVGRLSGADVTNCTNNANFTITNKMSSSDNASITAFGGVVGYSVGTNTIKGCTNKGNLKITATDININNVGGVVGLADGENATPTVDNCVNEGAVSINVSKSSSSKTNSMGYVGGIVGSNDKVTSMNVSNCTNKGEINISGNTSSIPSGCVVTCRYIGGIMGGTPKATTISKCMNTGNIILTDIHPDQHAGIVGYSGYSVALRIENCANVGDIICKAKLITSDASWGSTGGILGYINNSASSSFKGINGCYNAGKITTYLNNKGGIIGYYNGSLTAMPEACTNYYLQQDGINAINGTSISNMTNTAVTSADVSDGMLCYALNNGVTNGSQIWYQTIGNGSYPVFSGDTVYYYYDVDTEKNIYTNTKCTEHNYKDGICQRCGDYKRPMISAGAYWISNKGEFIWFANKVNDGTAATSNAVLKEDIDLSGSNFTAIGTESNTFTGTFDGRNHTITINQNSANDVALFGYVGSCTIKNLKVTGTTNTSIKFAGSIVKSIVSGATANIEHCLADVDIISTIEGDGTHGGIVGVANGNVNIDNCGFTGSIQGSTTDSCGGLIGWANGVTNISNSYMAGDLSGISNVNGNTFVRYRSATVTLGSCYYVTEHNATPTGATQITTDQLASGEVCYSLNKGVTDGTQAWYQAIDKDLYPVLSGDTVYCYYDEATEKNIYTNTKCTDHNYKNGICQRCGGYEPAEFVEGIYKIYNAGQFMSYANVVNKDRLAASHAMLMNDIDLSGLTFAAIGREGMTYDGTFDGGSHKITINQDSANDVAIFGWVGGCTIKNLVVTGTTKTNAQYGSGLVKLIEAGKTANINNCLVDVDIISSVEGDGTHGGIVGVIKGNVNINNCGFTGSIQGSTTDSCGGFIGWADKIVNISNSYMAGDLSDIGITNGNTFVRYGNATVTLDNCYYVTAHNATPTGATQITTDQLASGEVCYSLNNGVTDGTQVWYQTIGKDLYPVFNGHTVCYQNGFGYYNKGTGDVNRSGATDNVDVTIILRYINGTIRLEDYQRELADADENGVIDVRDVIILLNNISE